VEWKRKRVNLSYLYTWGCLVKVNVPINKKRRLGSKTVDSIFIGYAFHSIGYRFLIIKSGVPDMHVGTIMDSRDATFFEDVFPMRDDYCNTSQKSIINDEPSEMIEHNKQTLVENLQGDNETFRKSKRQRTAKSFGDDFIVYLVDDTPRTIEEAYSSLDADYWKEAIKSEMDSIMSNETWEVVTRRYGRKPIGCKWVFKKHYNKNLLQRHFAIDIFLICLYISYRVIFL
jgi:hypothetical protein